MLAGMAGQRGAGVVAIGASAGGVEALRAAVAGLPPELPAAVLVVLHIPRYAPSALPGILDRSGPLPAVPATHGVLARRARSTLRPPTIICCFATDICTMNLRLAEVAEGRERRRAAALYRQRYESSKVETGRLRELIGRVSSALEGSAVES